MSRVYAVLVYSIRRADKLRPDQSSMLLSRVLQGEGTVSTQLEVFLNRLQERMNRWGEGGGEKGAGEREEAGGRGWGREGDGGWWWWGWEEGSKWMNRWGGGTRGARCWV